MRENEMVTCKHCGELIVKGENELWEDTTGIMPEICLVSRDDPSYHEPKEDTEDDNVHPL
jgi:hypothetical protein